MFEFIIMTGLLFLLIVVGAPIGLAMFISGAAGVLMISGSHVATSVLRLTPYESVASYTLSTLPMFILMAEFLTASRFTRDLFDAANKWVGHFRGGLALAAVAGGVLLSAVSGSSSASAATLAASAFPEMRRFGYADSFSTSTIAVAGTLAILIPPSVALVLFGIITETSVGALFLAGILPGVLTAIGYYLSIRTIVRFSRDAAPDIADPKPMRERVASLGKVWPVLTLMIFLLVALYSGAATVTEIGALSALAALGLALGLGRLDLQRFVGAVVGAARTCSMIFLVIAGAAVFGMFATLSGVPQALLQGVQSSGLSPWVILLLFLGLLLLLGFFLDQLAVLLLVLPLAFPLLQSLDFNPVWIGILVVKTIEIGLLTPPMGLNCFVVASLTGVPVSRVFSGIWTFVIVDLAVTALLVLMPEITLLVPRYAGLVN